MIISHRRTYQADKTIGYLQIGDEVLGLTLEDIGRPAGIKIPKETCIPEGEYQVAVTMSTRFGREMLLLYTNAKDRSCDLTGCLFTGIRVHKGTKTEHTEGCVLYQGDLPALEKRVADAIASGDKVTWVIRRT
jgi:hypothetical protein